MAETRKAGKIADQARKCQHLQPDGISNRRIDSSKDQSAKFVAVNIEYGDVEG